MKKQCSGCGEKKLRKEFTKDASKPDGLHTRCKACKKPRVKAAPVDNARLAAIDRLIERHEGEFIRLWYSERVARGEVEPSYKLGVGWRAMAG